MRDSESFLDGKVILHPGDNLPALKSLASNSIDSVATDPPYGLGKEPDAMAMLRAWLEGGHYDVPSKSGFMGKQWDAFVPQPAVWREVYRVLKPGGHVVCFFGTRTYDLGVLAIRLAGFEIRDLVAWLYGSGFPKSLDVSKAIDKAAGAERTQVVGSKLGRPGMSKDGSNQRSGFDHAFGGERSGLLPSDILAPATESAAFWQGFGTALKPALEPICLARKPLIGTVAENVLTHGTGAINIDGCRVATDENLNGGAYSEDREPSASEWVKHGGTIHSYAGRDYEQPPGRWSANIVHDSSDEVMGAFPDAPGQLFASTTAPRMSGNVYGAVTANRSDIAPRDNGGSAARFFYTAKADSDDRLGSKHPTVKPLDLMQWLVRLVTPPGGVVLDPFAGTGTTGEAAWREGFRAILIEREAEYQNDIRRRMTHALAGPLERANTIAKLKPAPKPTGDDLFSRSTQAGSA